MGAVLRRHQGILLSATAETHPPVALTTTINMATITTIVVATTTFSTSASTQDMSLTSRVGRIIRLKITITITIKDLTLQVTTTTIIVVLAIIATTAILAAMLIIVVVIEKADSVTSSYLIASDDR